MAHELIKHVFQDYIDNNLSDSSKIEFESHIDTCNSCKNELIEYRDVIAQERIAKKYAPTASYDFVDQVMAAIKSENDFLINDPIIRSGRNYPLGFIGSINYILLLLQVVFLQIKNLS